MVVLIYLLFFCAVSMFVFMSFRMMADFRQGLESKKRLPEAVGYRQNIFYRTLMVAARHVARLNLGMNLGGYEAILKRRLDAAGRPWDLRPIELLAIKELSAVCVGGLGVMFHLSLATHRFPLIVSLGMVLVGFFLPNFFINRLTKQRQLSILKDLPFYCDLLTLAVEAGLDFGSALERVVGNGPPGPLRDELFMVFQETKIGKTRREALTDLSVRIQLQEVTNFVGSIVQADRMGTGFADVLRIQSKQVRGQRFERAEKTAQKLPVKILFPIIVVNLLSIGIILVVPLLMVLKDSF